MRKSRSTWNPGPLHALGRPMARSSDTRRPSWRKLLREAPAGLRLLAAQFRRRPVPREPVRGLPILVIPAFLAPDFVTRPLRRTLAACGHRAYGWRQGINIGARPAKFDGLLQRIDRIGADSGEKLVLIGW